MLLCQVYRGGKYNLLTIWTVILREGFLPPEPLLLHFQNEQSRDVEKAVVSSRLGLQAYWNDYWGELLEVSSFTYL